MWSMLFSPIGRINRAQFWVCSIGLMVFFMVLSLLSGPEAEPTMLIIALLICVLWSALALQIKRWHDRDKSGWWVLIGIIPVIGPIWALIENGLLPGTDGKNRFGAQP